MVSALTQAIGQSVVGCFAMFESLHRVVDYACKIAVGKK
jgi:hypothetical protein